MLGYYPVWCFTQDGKICFNDISDDEIDEILDGINGFQQRIESNTGKAIDQVTIELDIFNRSLREETEQVETPSFCKNCRKLEVDVFAVTRNGRAVKTTMTLGWVIRFYKGSRKGNREKKIKVKVGRQIIKTSGGYFRRLDISPGVFEILTGECRICTHKKPHQKRSVN